MAEESGQLNPYAFGRLLVSVGIERERKEAPLLKEHGTVSAKKSLLEIKIADCRRSLNDIEAAKRYNKKHNLRVLWTLTKETGISIGGCAAGIFFVLLNSIICLWGILLVGLIIGVTLAFIEWDLPYKNAFPIAALVLFFTIVIFSSYKNLPDGSKFKRMPSPADIERDITMNTQTVEQCNAELAEIDKKIDACGADYTRLIHEYGGKYKFVLIGGPGDSVTYNDLEKALDDIRRCQMEATVTWEQIVKWAERMHFTERATLY